MNKYLLIGGRSHEFKTKSQIYDFFLSNTNEILYIALANDNYFEGLNNFKKQISKDIKINILDINNIYNFKELLTNNSHIFIAGGSANLLIERFNKYQITTLFKKLNNKFIAGISAGAILLSEFGLGDKDVFYDNFSYYNFKMVQGLGILNFIICPHYNKQGIEIFNDFIKDYNLNAYALEDDTALLINENAIDIIKDTKTNSIYYFNKDEDYKMTSLYERTK